MSLESCIASARKWVKENSEVELNAKEFEQVGKLLDAAEQMGATPAEKNALMQDLVSQKLEVEQAKNRARQYLNALNVEKGKTQTLANVESWVENGHDKDQAPVDAWLARIRGGASRPGLGTNIDPLYLKETARTQYQNFFRNALGPEDEKVLMATKISDPMSRDIYQELDAIENKKQLGQSNNDTALRIAKAIRATQDYVLTDVKSVNPYVEAAKDFLVHRNHNRDAIVAVARDQWVKEAAENFNGSFAGSTPDEKSAMFGNIYDQIKAGTYGSTDFDAASFWKPGNTAGNQAARASGARTLVATDWLHEWQYASKYGDNIWQNMARQINSQSDTVARLQKWGPNPSENYQKEYSSILKSLDPEQQASFQRNQNQFKEAFEVTMGRQDNEAHGMRARSAQGLMAAQNAALMGQHVPRALNGYQAAMTLARDAFGKTYIENAYELSSRIAGKILTGDSGSDAAQALGVSLRNVSRDMMGSLATGERAPGFLAKAGELVGKLSLNDQRVSSLKFGISDFTAQELGSYSGKGFGDLSPRTQDFLNRYSLGGPQWEVLKQATATDGVMKGRITPESIRALTNDQVKPLTQNDNPREFNRVRSEMAMNYGVLLNDQAGLSAGESNSRSRIAAYGTTNVNEPWGIARRFMMQFKQAAIIEQQLVSRTFQSGGGSTSNISGVLQHVLASSFLGMAGEYVLQAAQGKELASPTSPEMISRAVLSMGGLGVYGDAIFHALEQPTPNKQKALMASEVLGPAFGAFSKAVFATAKTAKGVGQAFQGEEKTGQYGGKDWAQLIHGLVPGQNLFYTKAAMDYMLMNEMHEFMGGSGYLEGLRQQTGKTEGWPEALGGQGGRQQYTFGGKNFWE
jgi:hypothetical protein